VKHGEEKGLEDVKGRGVFFTGCLVFSESYHVLPFQEAHEVIEWLEEVQSAVGARFPS
jgi:hypothetical protein